jgi:hypothetical protein
MSGNTENGTVQARLLQKGIYESGCRHLPCQPELIIHCVCSAMRPAAQLSSPHVLYMHITNRLVFTTDIRIVNLGHFPNSVSHMLREGITARMHASVHIRSVV